MRCYKKVTRAIWFISIFFAISCTEPGIDFWEGYKDVFNADGRVNGYEITKGKPFVVNSFQYDEFSDVLYHTPKGKIDRIIEDNPDWEFVFYCQMDPADSTRLVKLLARYNCRFPVIIDPEGIWVQEYLKGRYNTIGVICDKAGHQLGVSVIGTSQSFFDSEFSSAKRAMLKTR